MKRLEGWRNFLLIESFLLWAGIMLIVLRPRTEQGYTADLLGAWSAFLLSVGGVVVAGILGRGANKWVESYGSRRPPSPPPPGGPQP